MKKSHAFTLIELLVVIAIVGFLSVITFALLQSAREKARAATILRQFEVIEKAMLLYMDDNNYNQWPRQAGVQCGECETASICGCGVVVCDCLSNNNFVDLTPDFLDAIPTPPLTGAFYVYDNYGDIFPTDPALFAGVNIRVNGMTPDDALTYFQRLDEMVDDSNGVLDGKIRWQDNDRIVYMLATDETQY